MLLLLTWIIVGYIAFILDENARLICLTKIQN